MLGRVCGERYRDDMIDVMRLEYDVMLCDIRCCFWCPITLFYDKKEIKQTGENI